MPDTTPLLLLLDGVLSQDEDKTSLAMARLASAEVPVSVPEATPKLLLSSAAALERIVSIVVIHRPEWARVSSEQDGSLPLHFAASIGNIPLANVILKANPKAAVAPNHKGKIPLHYAAREGRQEMVEFFVGEVPRTASIRSKKDKLALHFAAGEGHNGVVRALLKAYPEGARIPSKKGKVALHFAARWGYIQIARDLLSISPDTVSSIDHEDSSPLHDAAREGQIEMMKFLVRLYPEGLKQENIRGETPLFPAVRSRNVDLVRFMINAWPSGGSHVLQRVRPDDNVSQWDPDILELCLRGAVDLLAEENVFPVPVGTKSSISETGDEEETTAVHLASMKPVPKQDYMTDASGDGRVTRPAVHRDASCRKLSINVPRSKSPILEANQAKKRSPKNVEGSRKRARLSSIDGHDPLSEWQQTSEHREFHELHAALQCGASVAVLECVLDRHSEQITSLDELGRMPLHVAMEFLPPNRNDLASIILERIWKLNEDACSHRDFLGRLPLHHALKNCVDSKLIKALLSSNPSSGVEYCDVLDEKFMDKLPVEMAMACNCDLSTIYMLLRGDPSIVTTWSTAFWICSVT